jgi:hypothetical protein
MLAGVSRVDITPPVGVTFALGYTNGDALYFVASQMFDEGGYEPEGYWQYGFPAPLAPGTERTLAAGVQRLRELGVRQT